MIGRGTAALSQRRPGETLPSGGRSATASARPPQARSIFVAGGIGQTPFLALGRWWLGRAIRRRARRRPDDRPTSSRLVRRTPGPGSLSPAITLLYGVRTAAFWRVSRTSAAGIEVELATDDGTAGHHGFVTDIAGPPVGER